MFKCIDVRVSLSVIEAVIRTFWPDEKLAKLVGDVMETTGGSESPVTLFFLQADENKVSRRRQINGFINKCIRA